MREERTITPNQANLKTALRNLPIGAVFLLIYLAAIRTLVTTGFIKTFLLFVLGGIALLFFAIGIAALASSLSQTPLAKIGQQGIWHKNFGLIPWNAIRDITVYRYKDSPMEMVAIWVYDTKALSKTASRQGKIALFWSKKFNTPPVTISNSTQTPETIVRLAKQFLEHEKTSVQ